MRIIRNLVLFIIVVFLLINFLLDFSFITDQFGKNEKQLISKYLISHKNTSTLEKEIEDLTKERNKFERLHKMMEEVYTDLKDDTSEMEHQSDMLDRVFRQIDPSEFDMKFKKQRKDLNYGYDGRLNIYDDNLSVKFYTPIGDTLLYGISNRAPGSGFLDTYEDNLILVSSAGIIGYSKKPLNKPKLGISLKQIQNNLNNYIDVEQFKKSRHYDDPKFSWLRGGWYSIKDIEIFGGDIYVSYTKEVKENCWNTSLLAGKMNYVYIHFKTVFTSEECVNEYDIVDDEYNAHQSGGRIINLNNETVLFSIGDFRNRYRAQMENSIFGKVIKINKKNKNYEVISMGHRNPQGLFYNKEENILLEAEHGPQGGDEINVIKLDHNIIQNFGWAVSSYGEHYGGKFAPDNKKKYVKYPLHKSHTEYGFIEPLIYFDPSIGISQIIGLNEQNKYVVASMKDESLYFFDYDYNDENITSPNKVVNGRADNIEIKRVNIGERIRDMIYYNKKLYLYLEDTASLAEVSFN